MCTGSSTCVSVLQEALRGPVRSALPPGLLACCLLPLPSSGGCGRCRDSFGDGALQPDQHESPDDHDGRSSSSSFELNSSRLGANSGVNI